MNEKPLMIVNPADCEYVSELIKANELHNLIGIIPDFFIDAVNKIDQINSADQLLDIAERGYGFPAPDMSDYSYIKDGLTWSDKGGKDDDLNPICLIVHVTEAKLIECLIYLYGLVVFRYSDDKSSSVALVRMD